MDHAQASEVLICVVLVEVKLQAVPHRVAGYPVTVVFDLCGIELNQRVAVQLRLDLARFG